MDAIFWAEFMGTAFLILLGNGAVCNVLLAKTKGFQSGWIVITAGWGLAVALALYLTGWISGGHFNPAVTLSFYFFDKVTLGALPSYLLGQFSGAFVGALLAYFVYFSHFQKTLEPHLKFLCFATAPAVYKPFVNLITEIVATAVLLMGILAVGNLHNQIAVGFSPFLIGLIIFAIGLSLGGPTGFALNPARDFSPRLVYALLPLKNKVSFDWNYFLIPILGPCIGGVLGTWIYKTLIGF